MKPILNKLKYFSLLSSVVFLIPVIAFAQTFSLKNSTFKTFIDEVLSVISILIPILFASAIIFFFWGLSKFILNSGSKEGVKQGRDYMLWGILAIFILLSVRTIIGLVANELDIGDAKNVPLLPTNATTPVTSGRLVQ